MLVLDWPLTTNTENAISVNRNIGKISYQYITNAFGWSQGVHITLLYSIVNCICNCTCSRRQEKFNSDMLTVVKNEFTNHCQLLHSAMATDFIPFMHIMCKSEEARKARQRR